MDEQGRAMRWARRINIALALIGLALFGALFTYVSAFPRHFDETVRTIAIGEVERRVDARLDEAAHSRATDVLVNVAGAISPELGRDADRYRSMLAMGTDELIGELLISACRLDCEDREAAQARVEEVFRSQFGRYRAALDRLQAIVVGEFDEVMAEFRADIRMVALANIVAFGLALILALIRGRAARQLLAVSIILALNTFAMMAIYVFAQDWVATIIFGNYWGVGYAIWLALLTAIMTDIAANRARITTFGLELIGAWGAR